MPRLEQPDGYTDEEWEAYQSGFRNAMAMVASAASAWAAGATDGTPLAMDAPWEDAEEGDEGLGTCEECGGERVQAMGREKAFCPRCDV